jgi:hypothetical protein
MGKKQKTKNKKKIPFISKCKMHSFICSYSFVQEARENCCGDWRGGRKRPKELLF